MKIGRVTWIGIGAALIGGTGCGADASGAWTGDMSCVDLPGLDLHMAMTLDQTGGDRYDGTGTINFYDYDGYYWELNFNVGMAHDSVWATSSDVDVDLGFTDCSEIDLGAMTCPEARNVAWDPADGTMSGEIWELFDYYTCDFDLE